MRRRGARNVFIIGFMASGKSRLGRELALRLGRCFMDIDAQIELAAGCSISEIFARQGERRFRALEAAAIRRAARGRGKIVAVGGGGVMSTQNVAAMRRGGVVLYRETPFEIIFRRAERAGRAQRPLWQGKSKSDRRRSMAALYEARKPHYRGAAHLTLRTRDASAGSAASRAMKALLKGGWIEE